MQGLLTLKQVNKEQIHKIIDLALKYKGGFSKNYSNFKIATLFFENSTRTQYSFQMAMLNLGITPITFNISSSSVAKGETLYDTVKTFEAIGVDGVVIRHNKDRYFEELENIQIPIFNAGDGASNHPTQNLLDLMTIYEEFGSFEGLRVCIIGDIKNSRVAHGNIEIMRRLGMDVFVSGPEEFMDDLNDYLPFEEAIESCDVIMLLRVQFERGSKLNMSIEEYHERFGLHPIRVEKMKEKAIIMHPAPVNRNVEISDEVVECNKSRIVKQMTNGVYIRMAVISMVLEGEL